MTILLELFWTCFQTSLVSFGGVHGGISEWQRVFVTERGWLTAEQLMESYVVGQLAPGPSMVVAVLLGERVAGTPGAVAAFLGTYTAPVLFALGLGALLRRVREVRWMRQVEVALRPLVVGFMAATALGIAQAQWAEAALPMLVVGLGAAACYARGLLRPVPLMMSAGAAYWLVIVLLVR